MPRSKFLRPVLAAGVLGGVVASGAGAASDPAAIPVTQASAAYIEVLRGAVPLGWNEAEFTAWNDAGVQTETNDKPQCVIPAQRDELPDSLAAMFAAFGRESACTTTAYEPGTLRFGMRCAKEGKTFTFDSSGTFTGGAIDLKIKLKATGDGAPDLGSMHVIARHARDCTPQEIAAATAELAGKGGE